MIFSETDLFGAFLIEPELLADERGFFARAWCPRELAAAEPARRVLEPVAFDARDLGRDFARLAPPLPEFTLFGGMMVGKADIANVAQGAFVESISPPFVAVFPSTPDRNTSVPALTADDSGRLGQTDGPKTCRSPADAMIVISATESEPTRPVTAPAAPSTATKVTTTEVPAAAMRP